ncbi:MAG: hypothetical protein A3I11_05545 [Elusimicrobia bacterium RIFCSPLOWO2_02_FULL_39_32]|nr:MAG: hypothetical protein A3B80_00060 [Elusimicrobia bacterium RIFCSPHIGHO2_02_FULL_39_36]OGR91207.1 MAG: hypothetical protein A3I11_05545 [Elusimicrobia bacterium RIFCSPLOWO2_02_FULL_39_32]OGS00175.1 MAG: hypothetical protein A3G85_08510 [Elusimicrobia bacterium RIFCSPLOWO2_12_FULL_39_28]
MKSFFSHFFNLFSSHVEPSFGNHKRNLESLLAASQLLAAGQGLEEALKFVLPETRKIFEIGCGCLLLEEDQVFKFQAQDGFPEEWVSHFKCALGKGAIGQAFASGDKFILSKKEFIKSHLSEHGLSNIPFNQFFIAPLRIPNQQTLAVFIAASQKSHFFEEKIIAFLEPFLQILSVTIYNSQMMEKLEKFNRRLESEVTVVTQELTSTNNRLIRRFRELKALYEIALAAGETPSLEGMFEIVAMKLEDIFKAEAVGFFLKLSHGERWNHLVAQFPSFGLPKGDHSKFILESEHYSEYGPYLKAVLDAFKSEEIKIFVSEPSSLKDELPWKTSSSLKDHFSARMLHSLVAVPLKSSQVCVGVMVLANWKEKEFLSRTIEQPTDFLTEEEIRALSIIAVRVASCVETVHLDLESKNRLAALMALQEITQVFYANPVLDQVLLKIVAIIRKIEKCDLCSFMVYEPETKELITRASYIQDQPLEPQLLKLSVRDDQHLTAHVFNSGKSKILNEITPQMRSEYHLEIEAEIESLLLVPLKSGQDILGVLKLGSHEKFFFTPYHVSLAELIAERTAAIILNSRLYEKLVEANKELERLSQIKTEFVSVVSHELRTPVTAIKGFVNIVMNQEAGPINPDQERFLKLAYNAIERLSFLISDLLDISRIEAGQIKLQPASLSMEKILQETKETFQSTIKSKEINFVVQVASNLPQVFADEFRIKQVLDNLLSNAIKFTPKQGTIQMAGENMGDFVLVSVSDTGIGVKKEDQGNIFKKFYQVDSSLTRSAGGTGLGLSICKAIVEMHGGRIWVESEVGKGSFFRFVLPRLKVKEGS